MEATDVDKDSEESEVDELVQDEKIIRKRKNNNLSHLRQKKRFLGNNKNDEVTESIIMDEVTISKETELIGSN